ncbi:hypothetical protein BJV74DRAFT_843783, partial [Russula compacta]
MSLAHFSFFLFLIQSLIAALTGPGRSRRRCRLLARLSKAPPVGWQHERLYETFPSTPLWPGQKTLGPCVSPHAPHYQHIPCGRSVSGNDCACQIPRFYPLHLTPAATSASASAPAGSPPNAFSGLAACGCQNNGHGHQVWGKKTGQHGRDALLTPDSFTSGVDQRLCLFCMAACCVSDVLARCFNDMQMQTGTHARHAIKQKLARDREREGEKPRRRLFFS